MIIEMLNTTYVSDEGHESEEEEEEPTPKDLKSA